MTRLAATHGNTGRRRRIVFLAGWLALAGTALAFADPRDDAIDRTIAASLATRAESVTEARLAKSIALWPGELAEWVLIDEWIVQPEAPVPGTPPGRVYRSAVFALRGAGAATAADDRHPLLAVSLTGNR